MCLSVVLSFLAIVALCCTAASSSSDQEVFFGLMVGDQDNSRALSGIVDALDDISRSNLLSGYNLSYIYSEPVNVGKTLSVTIVICKRMTL